MRQATQVSALVARDEPEYVPGEQAVHVLAPAAEYVPGLQGEHVAFAEMK